MIPKIEEYKKLSIEEINARIDANDEKLDELWHSDNGDDYEVYRAKCRPYWDDNYCLSTAKTMIMPKEEVKLWDSTELDNGCRMPIKKFIGYCECGAICGSDGAGYYATENKVAHLLEANPRAFCDGYIRDDFDYVCWYNK